MVEHGSPEQRTILVAAIKGNVLPYSQHKFASNVVEKCMMHTDRATRRQLVAEIIVERKDGATPLGAMIKDPYANYVVQRLLDLADRDQMAVIARFLSPLYFLQVDMFIYIYSQTE